MNPTDEAKTISMVLLSVVTLILGLIPIPIAHTFKWRKGGKDMSSLAKNILSGLLCFGAGVLMATAIVHLLPEVHDGMATLKDNGTVTTDLPLAEIILGAGFFLVYLVEEVVHMISDRHAHNKTDVSIHRSVGVRECSISREGQPMPPCHPPSEDVEDGKCRAASICTVTDNSQCDEQVFCRDVTEPSVATISISSNGNHHDHDDDEKLGNRRKSSVHHHHHHHHHDLSDGDNVLPSVRGLLVILGLSLHEIFEGIAIGLETDPESVWGLFAAVATHKFVIAFCIGLEMTTSGVRISLHVFYMLVLAAVTSLGIGIGMLLIDGESTSLALTTLVLQGLAAGTLVYVAFFEVLERERSKSNIKLLQWTTLALGFLALIGMEALLPEHEHGDDHDHTGSTISTVTEFIDSF